MNMILFDLDIAFVKLLYVESNILIWISKKPKQIRNGDSRKAERQSSCEVWN